MRRRRLIAPCIVMVVSACAELNVAKNLDHDNEGAEVPGPGSDGASSSDGGANPGVNPKDGGEDSSHPPPCDGTCLPEPLVEGLHQATVITVDATNVYFAVEAGSGIVYQCPKTGCKGSPIELGRGYAMSIVAAGGKVYWADFEAGKLQSCAIGGCNKLPTAVVSNQVQIKGTVTDGVDLFWATTGVIKHCTRMTCTTDSAEEITPAQGFIGSLAAAQAKVVWPNSAKKTVFICPAGPCPTPTALGPGTGDISIHDGTAYWINGGTKNVVKCPLAGCGGSPTTVGASSAPGYPISDGVNVYWRDALAEEIYRCPETGCMPGPEIIATKQHMQPNGQIALDSEYVYWTNTTGVYRLHK